MTARMKMRTTNDDISNEDEDDDPSKSLGTLRDHIPYEI
jgi:hypothetical protein